MNKKNILIAALIFSLIMLAILLLQRPKSVTSINDTPKDNAIHAQQKAATPNTLSLKATSNANSQFTKITECLKLESPASNLSQLKSALLNNGSAWEKIEHWKNNYYSNANGEKYIVRVEKSENAQNQEINQLKIFKEDDQGVPLPIHTLEIQSYEFDEQVIKKIIGDVQLDFSGKVYTEQNQGIEINVNEEDGQPTYIKIKKENTFSECEIEGEEFNCKCSNSI